MLLRAWGVAAALFAAALAGKPAQGQVPEICPDQFPLSSGFKIPYCHNYPLDIPRPIVDRLVIAIHGAERQATITYDAVLAAAQTAGEDATTLIIAPQFLNEQDTGLPDDVLYWTGAFWRLGNNSVNGQPRVSSYEVLDIILSQIADSGNFPNIRNAIVAGHSAGGQFTQRFAAGSPVENHISAELGIPMRYVVMNSGSWLYLDPARWDPDTTSFTPPDPASCPGYDDYPYGLRANLNQYMRAAGADMIRTRYGQRQLAYLLGDQDICRPDEVCTTPPGSPPPDAGCAAMLQGATRFERGTTFYGYVQYYYPDDILNRHSLDIVPGVGHDGNAMFASSGSLCRIFDYTP